MSFTILSRGSQGSITKSVIPPLLYPTLYTYRAASITRAIGRGIQRSKDVGFRGKEKDRKGVSHSRDEAVVRRTAESMPFNNPTPMTRGWGGAIQKASEVRQTSYATPQRRERETSGKPFSRRQDPDDNNAVKIRMGKRIVKEREDKPRRIAVSVRNRDPDSSFGKRSTMKRGTTAGQSLYSEQSGKGNADQVSGRDKYSDKGKTAYRQGDLGMKMQREKDYDRGGRRSSTGSFSRSPGSNAIEAEMSMREGAHTSFSGAKRSHSEDRPAFKAQSRNSRQDYFADGESSRDNRSGFRDRGPNHSDRSLTRPKGDDPAGNQSRFSQSIDKRIPLSIPYTTPASEFLYGTSVVEAALRSKRVPRRKYYKLYIYSGENRDNSEKDAGLERLARRSGVEVAKVSGDWLRLMDKMTNSRPHNGYILEASPLPRLPVQSLGELTDDNGEPGFKITLDHQSREEVAVNGSSDFIQYSDSPTGRKPLVLFLDSIQDPGNLGGIIRTASFLGVTAIAISKNCAPISPVVLKASAGASENITIFTVNKPAGFIADSKLAGWKIFAAVAPGGQPAPLTTDALVNPLDEDPCILMLGSEGEGLRMNLRAKADVNLTIRGSGQSFTVDSLNVSVATGILCNSFMRKSRTQTMSPRVVASVDIPEDGERARTESIESKESGSALF